MKKNWSRPSDKRNAQFLKWLWIYVLVGLVLSIPLCVYIAIWGSGDSDRWGWTAGANAIFVVVLFLLGGLLLDAVGVFDDSEEQRR